MLARRGISIAALTLAGVIPPLLPPILGSPPPPPPPIPGSGFPSVGAPLFYDDGGPPGPRSVWGAPACERASRVGGSKEGGDPSRGADGRAQDGASFRRVRVLDGDDFYGERCELGENDHRSSPVALYHEGERRITYLSLRLGSKFPLSREAWQVVMQMKQAQPSDSGGGVPVLALHAYDGRWRLEHNPGSGRVDEIWSAPAEVDRWVRLAFDVAYSSDPEKGSVRVYVDLNGDGDVLDDGERSARFGLRTLKLEGPTNPGDGVADDGVAEGTGIPSHLRVGLYHNPSYRCRRSKCSVGIDNVGVYEPGN